MKPMRQRLLLVAGWATAAVVASLVSTGAVAVAGGQVTDRPLRPLSASEVAALAEECGSTERAPCLRQLEESADPLVSVSAEPELNSGLEGDEDGVSPTTVVAQTTPPPSDDALDPAADVDESLLPPVEDDAPTETPEPRGEVVDLVGGRVSVSGADGEVKVLWLIPRHGFAMLPATGAEILPGQVTVVLADGSHQSTLIASWDESEGLVVETREGGLDSTDS